MDYESEIAALKETVFVLLEADQRRSVEYKKVVKRYKEVVKALMQKDKGFQELVTLYHDSEEKQKVQATRLEPQIIKLSELEDVLEDLV